MLGSIDAGSRPAAYGRLVPRCQRTAVAGHGHVAAERPRPKTSTPAARVLPTTRRSRRACRTPAGGARHRRSRGTVIARDVRSLSRPVSTARRPRRASTIIADLVQPVVRPIGTRTAASRGTPRTRPMLPTVTATIVGTPTALPANCTGEPRRDHRTGRQPGRQQRVRVLASLEPDQPRRDRDLQGRERVHRDRDAGRDADDPPLEADDDADDGRRDGDNGPTELLAGLAERLEQRADEHQHHLPHRDGSEQLGRHDRRFPLRTEEDWDQIGREEDSEHEERIACRSPSSASRRGTTAACAPCRPACARTRAARPGSRARRAAERAASTIGTPMRRTRGRPCRDTGRRGRCRCCR